MAMEYGSSPVEAAQHQMRRRRAPRVRVASQGRQRLARQVLEVMRLAEERGQIGGDRVDELLELGGSPASSSSMYSPKSESLSARRRRASRP